MHSSYLSAEFLLNFILQYLHWGHRCVNHKTEFNTESEPFDRIELSDKAK